MADREETLRVRLSAVLNAARKINAGVSPLVTQYTQASTEFLAGVIGAIVSGGGTYLALWYFLLRHPQYELPAIFVTTLVGLATLLGISIGIFLFRGSSQRKAERRVKRLKQELKALRMEIVELQELGNAPPEVFADLWAAYKQAIQVYRDEVQKCRRGDVSTQQESKAVSAPKRELPPAESPKIVMTPNNEAREEEVRPRPNKAKT